MATSSSSGSAARTPSPSCSSLLLPAPSVTLAQLQVAACLSRRHLEDLDHPRDGGRELLRATGALSHHLDDRRHSLPEDSQTAVRSGGGHTRGRRYYALVDCI
jgi:hypothetical protein